MPNSAGLNVHHVISAVYAVVYTRESTAAKQHTSVIITVHFVKMRSNFVVHRTSFGLWSRLPADLTTALATLGSMCMSGEQSNHVVFSSAYSCVVNAHLCGGPCKLSGNRGCLQDCTKVSRGCYLL